MTDETAAPAVDSTDVAETFAAPELAPTEHPEVAQHEPVVHEVQTELLPMAALEIGKIHQGNCLELMQQIDTGSIDLVFADPPFNIGYEYDEYHDRHEDDDYLNWSRQWMEEVHRILKPGGTFWLAIGDEYAAELKVDAEHKIGFTTRSWVVWYYTFGVNCTKKFSRSHVHLFHFVKDENKFTFNAEDPSVRVPSARALVYADKRANPKGRLPDDTWILRPQDLPHGFDTMDDTVYFARVAGTFSERQGFHGCQMPEQLLGRIVRVSSNPGDVVFDPFAGSGTTLAVAKKLGRKLLGCELSEQYVRSATERLETIQVGDALDGPADPIASAPSTSNGRKLAELREKQAEQPAAATSLVAANEVSDKAAPKTAKRELRDLIRDTIVEAFFAAHDGYSIDWMLANPQLQAVFHEECREAGLIGTALDWNRELLRIRKQGGFPKRGAIKKVHVTDEELDAYDFAAEIGWRMANDKFHGPSLDEILCDPEKAAYFGRLAKKFAPGFEPVNYRWAALRLRKASRDLVDEVKQYHFVFAKRDFTRFQSWNRFKASRFNGQPGIYLLRGDDKEPLYVGYALDLGQRLAMHLDCPAMDEAVAQVSILAGDELVGEEYRAAFKEDLVRRYQPKWNVNLVGLAKSAAE
jgi:DNA modification methylase/predicted GIY-YIG superfamily endonuclease